MGQGAVLTPRPWREELLSPRTLPPGDLCAPVTFVTEPAGSHITQGCT